MQRGPTFGQRLAVCFTAGVIGGLSVVLFSHLLFAAGIGQWLGIASPVSLHPPEIYRPLFWGGLWGLPLALILRSVWNRLFTFGLLYFLAPLAALYFFFLPMRGEYVFSSGAGFPLAVYLFLVNVPYGIVTAVFIRGLVGKNP